MYLPKWPDMSISYLPNDPPVTLFQCFMYIVCISVHVLLIVDFSLPCTFYLQKFYFGENTQPADVFSFLMYSSMSQPQECSSSYCFSICLWMKENLDSTVLSLHLNYIRLDKQDFLFIFSVLSGHSGFSIPATTTNDLRLPRIFYPRLYPLHLFFLSLFVRKSQYFRF